MSLEISKNNQQIFNDIFEPEINGIKYTITTFYDDNNNPWFIANDISRILGYKIPKDAVKDHIRVKNKIYFKMLHDRGETTPSNIHPMTVLCNEPGLYQLVMSSKNTQAVKFQDWVFEELLPSIRQKGFYRLEKIIDKKNIENTELKSLMLDMKNQHTLMSMEMTERFDKLMGFTQDIKNKLDTVEEKLDIATDDRVPQPLKKSKIEQFVILKLGNIEPNTYNYYAIRGQIGNVNRQIKLKQKKIEGVKILLNITYQPNSRNLFIRMKEELSHYMDFDANNFDIKNISEKDFIDKVIELNNDKKIV